MASKAQRQYGLGRIFRKTREKDGVKIEMPTWYIQYNVGGKTFRESTGTDNYNKAQNFLKKRFAEAQVGTPQTYDVRRVTVGELLDDLLTDYKTYHPRSVKCFAQPVITNLKEWFGHMKAVNVSTTHLKAYIQKRLAAEMAEATVNREISMLRRAYNLGKQHTPPKVVTTPTFTDLLFDERGNARQGFFEHDQFLKMREALPRDERDVLIYAYYTGCRRSEILKLTWQYVDLASGAIRLPAEDRGTDLHMKSGAARIIPLGGPGNELWDMLKRRAELRESLCPRTPWVFFKSENRGNRGVAAKKNVGRPLRNIYKVWNRVAEETGVNLLLHDLRRTGARNLIRAGVSEAVAMRITGHKTRAVFDRYNIGDERDLHDAAEKLNAYVARNGDKK